MDVAHASACRAGTRAGAWRCGSFRPHAPRRVSARHAEACATSSSNPLQRPPHSNCYIVGMRRRAIAAFLLCSLKGAENRKTQNLILVTADGLRRQEVFGGIDALLMREKDAGMDKTDALRRRLEAATPEQRRERLMPFLWRRFATRGVV